MLPLKRRHTQITKHRKKERRKKERKKERKEKERKKGEKKKERRKKKEVNALREKRFTKRKILESVKSKYDLTTYLPTFHLGTPRKTQKI